DRFPRGAKDDRALGVVMAQEVDDGEVALARRDEAGAVIDIGIRSPYATRPWQHVLEPLSGYLALGQKLFEEQSSFACGWNFGPSGEGNICVEKVTSALAQEWRDIKIKIDPPADAPHEAGLLALDCSKAKKELNWHGVWTPEETFRYTASWYKEFYTKGRISNAENWADYISSAQKEGLAWTK
ncbi:MAG: hypothetical protein IKA32_08300, partial [Lentisphaeria bacterium]|nr:hypothetical protein [Lentisphaeria bacterium]